VAESVRRVRWALFVPLVVAVVVLDQLTKAWILGNVPPGGATEILGPYLRLILSDNTGGLFGLFAGNAPVFAVVSIAVMVLIVAYESRVGAAYLPSIALGLLLGGAIGNFIDRIRIGYVVDFVDMGVGNLRWYTFNVADAAISASIVLLIAMAVVPALAELGSEPSSPSTPAAPSTPHGDPTEASAADEEARVP
jgi:signal peptidase II